MTTQQTKLAGLGRGYWHEYTRTNGYSFRPTAKGTARLARQLDLTASHIGECITLYLDA